MRPGMRNRPAPFTTVTPGGRFGGWSVPTQMIRPAWQSTCECGRGCVRSAETRVTSLIQMAPAVSLERAGALSGARAAHAAASVAKATTVNSARTVGKYQGCPNSQRTLNDRRAEAASATAPRTRGGSLERRFARAVERVLHVF